MTAVNIRRIMGNILRLGGITLKDDNGGLALRNSDDTADAPLSAEDITALGELFVASNSPLLSDRRGQALHGSLDSRAVWRNIAMMPVMDAGITLSGLNSVLFHVNTLEIQKFPHLLVRYRLGSTYSSGTGTSPPAPLFVRVSTGFGTPITTGYAGTIRYTLFTPSSGANTNLGTANSFQSLGDFYVPGDIYASAGQLGIGSFMLYNWQSTTPYARIAMGHYYTHYAASSTSTQIRLSAHVASSLNSSLAMTGLQFSLANGNFTTNGKISIYGVHEEVI